MDSFTNTNFSCVVLDPTVLLVKVEHWSWRCGGNSDVKILKHLWKWY